MAHKIVQTECNAKKKFFSFIAEVKPIFVQGYKDRYYFAIMEKTNLKN